MLELALALVAAFSASNQLDINQATLEEIRELPVPARLAEGIFDYLQEYGRFRSVYDLMKVKGMSSARLEELKPLVYVSQQEEEARLVKVHLIQRRLAAEDGPTQAAVEEWQDMLLAPLNVNRASVSDLVMLDGVSLVDAAAVVRYLKSGQQIRSRRDLASNVPGLSGYGYRNMRDFVAYDDMFWTGLAEDDRRYAFGGNYRVEFDSDEDWETEVGLDDFSQAFRVLAEDSAEFREAGYTEAELEFFRNRIAAEQSFLGAASNRSSLRHRARVRAGRSLRAGGWVGQEFSEPGAVDGYRGFVQVQDLGPVRRVFLGDYRVALGQGLLLDNNPELRARVHERPEGVFNDLDENPGFGFRGGAAELEHGRFGLLGFLSKARRDAILNPDSTVNYLITSQPRYSTFKDAVAETDIGASARYDLAGLASIPTGTRLGLNVLAMSYDRSLVPDARYLDLPGDAEALTDPNYTRLDSGRTRLFYGADFRAVVENVSFETELALKPDRERSILPGKGTELAYLAKARAQYNFLYVTALFRHFDLGYDNPYNRGYCEQLRFEDTEFEKPYRLIDPAYSALEGFPMPKAEQGFLLETRYQISRQVTFTRAYVDVWRNLAWGVNNARFQGEVEWRPVYPVRLRFKQKVQSKGLPKPALSTRSLTLESSIRMMTSLGSRDFLSAELREGRVMLTPNLEYGDKASMSGNFLSVQWEHEFSDGFSAELGVASWLTRDMSHWILDDVGIDFLEGDGFRWYLALSDRISERLLVYFKCRQKVSLFPRTGLNANEGIHFPGSAEPVPDFMVRDDRFGVSLQVDLFW